jgi:hypothetical protein
VLKEAAPAEVLRDFEQVVANMQLAYAAAARDAPKGPEPSSASGEPEPQPEPEDLEPVDDEELGGGG